VVDYVQNQPPVGFGQESKISDLYNNTVPDDPDPVDHGGDPKSGMSSHEAPS
jgi:hypothetical protein